MKYNFVNMDQIDFDADSLYKASLPQILSAPSDYDYYNELQKFMACFNDGHTEIINRYTPNDMMDYFDLLLKEFNGKVHIIHMVVRPVVTDSTWLGAEIIEIDNMPVKQYITDSLFPYISASTPQHKMMQGVYNIHYNYTTKPFNAKIRKTDGKEVLISLPRNGERIRNDSIDNNIGSTPKYGFNMVEFSLTPDSLAVLTINSFSSDTKLATEIGKYIPELQKAKGLVIDLRINGGGSTNAAWWLQSMLTPKGTDSFLNFGWETRVNNGVKKANSNWKPQYKDYYTYSAVEYFKPDTVVIPDSIPRITCPAVILAGNYTFSAAEDFLVNIYEIPNRPKIIGEPTGGSTGSPLVVPLGESYARICTRRICYPYSGKRFVNEGVQPDVVVKPTVDDYIHDKDVVLEAGLNYLRNLN